jgi:hypothetical protein
MCTLWKEKEGFVSNLGISFAGLAVKFWSYVQLLEASQQQKYYVQN